jgi:phage baseplate assembly protein W
VSTYFWTVPTSPNQAPEISEIDRAQQQFFGTDIRFRNDYFLDRTGDYMLDVGIEALRQAIYRRLITRPGEYKHVPDYGVGVQSYLKGRATRDNIERLKTAIKTQLLRDQRVEAIEDIAVESDEYTTKIGLKIRASGRALRFTPFEFSTGA